MSAACDHCRGSGVPYTSAMGNDFCGCSIGIRERQDASVPSWPDTILLEVADRERAKRMAAEGRVMCFACDVWVPSEGVINKMCVPCTTERG
jgi:hypothetical protein